MMKSRNIKYWPALPHDIDTLKTYLECNLSEEWSSSEIDEVISELQQPQARQTFDLVFALVNRLEESEASKTAAARKSAQTKAPDIAEQHAEVIAAYKDVYDPARPKTDLYADVGFRTGYEPDTVARIIAKQDTLPAKLYTVQKADKVAWLQWDWLPLLERHKGNKSSAFREIKQLFGWGKTTSLKHINDMVGECMEPHDWYPQGKASSGFRPAGVKGFSLSRKHHLAQDYATLLSDGETPADALSMLAKKYCWRLDQAKQVLEEAGQL